MKDLFFRFCRWALPLLGVSTAISCDNVFQSPDMYGTMVAEYGVPVMEYKIKGKVTDAYSGEPVKGIKVTGEESYEPVYTSESGEFSYEGTAFPDGKVTLVFADVDGKDNGMYLKETVEVSVEKSKDGSGAWYAGLYIADDVRVRLLPDFPPAYGTPVAEFSVKGKVTDADENPIGNIEVSGAYNSVRTAADGTFEYKGEEVSTSELSEITLHFTDRDGEENGGEFETKTEIIPLVQTDPGDGAWDSGDYTAENVRIILQKK